jgi:hypothetical protein
MIKATKAFEVTGLSRFEFDLGTTRHDRSAQGNAKKRLAGECSPNAVDICALRDAGAGACSSQRL